MLLLGAGTIQRIVDAELRGYSTQDIYQTFIGVDQLVKLLFRGPDGNLQRLDRPKVLTSRQIHLTVGVSCSWWTG